MNIIVSFTNKCNYELKRIRNKLIYIKEVRIRKKNEKRISGSKEKVLAFKNIHKGERCFIIGNGPSLRIEDLEKLNNEITFAANRIYKLYDRTYWRPTYYIAQDLHVIRSSARELNRIQNKNAFIALITNEKYSKIKDAIWLKLDPKYGYPSPPMFSEDISEKICEGMTVTYGAIQVAVYMGFKEIYLIGVDHSYSMDMKADGTIVVDNNIKDYADSRMSLMKNKNAFLPQLDKTTLAYKTANEYAKEHSICIFNATRGGKLEEFPRIDFDQLMKGREKL